MSQSPHAIDLLTFPLSGNRLIEASAGTGKTYTIAFLYLRLVLGHGDLGWEDAQPLRPEEILVVTFTEAATQELRSRIRRLLAQAACCFRTQDPQTEEARAAWPLLCALRADYPGDQWPEMAQRLDRAAQAMDESAISTIHGWCHRMLKEHALYSGTSFQHELQVDAAALRRQVVRDYWRRFYDPLPAADIARVTGFWNHPDALDAALAYLLPYASWVQAPSNWLEWSDSFEDADSLTLDTLMAAHDRQVMSLLAPMKQAWQTWVPELKVLFDKASDERAFDARRFSSRWYTAWLTAIAQWAADSTAIGLSLGKGFDRLTPEGLAEVWRGPVPSHPALLQIRRLRETLDQLPSVRALLLQHALSWVAQACLVRRRARAEVDFDDMLHDLARALAGENREALANAIRSRFPVALIDEFQDTDPVQYQIFDRIYGEAAQRAQTALILIGDPKQAIYSFRQADIYTYLQARHDAADRLYTLTTNYRSTRAMVQAINFIFAQAEAAPESRGAFLFRADEDNPVPFNPVLSAGRDADFVVQGAVVKPVNFVVSGHADLSSAAKDETLQDLAEACARQIAGWLAAAESGELGFRRHQDGAIQPLTPGDIAILVDNGFQARAMRRALSRQGLRSVYLSDKESVYRTPQAVDVFHLLNACAHPHDDTRVRAALSTRLLGVSFDTLYDMRQSELAWEVCIEQFRAYQYIWRERGVLPMLRRILFDYQVAPRLLSLAEDAWGQTGERILTDLLHMAELLQQARGQCDGPDALLRFFAEQMTSELQEDDNRRRRLETDEHLIQVITVHKSKGLEYPLVYLPFAYATRPVKADDLPVKWHDPSGQLQVIFHKTHEGLARAEEERLAEDLRKLYVALTRARYFVWVGMAPPRQDDAPRAIDYLLGLQNTAAADYGAALQQRLPDTSLFAFERTSQDSQAVGRQQARSTSFTQAPSQTQHPALPIGRARVPQRRRHLDWIVTSYSGLKAGSLLAEQALLQSDAPQADKLEEIAQDDAIGLTEASWGAQSAMHRFPKGSEAGSFLHSLLEWAAHQGFAAVCQSPEAFTQHVALQCQARGWAPWADALARWLLQSMATPLVAAEARFALHQASLVKPEVEFWFEACGVDLLRLDQIVAQQTLSARPRRLLTAQGLTGMFKGFIDLIVMHNGQYFVLDYKSNWLGPTDASYTPEALAAAVLDHRYELQYSLYLLALHRLLRSRIPDYDYDRHIGGALYFFLRGLQGPSGGLFFEKPAKAMIDALDTQFAGSER